MEGNVAAAGKMMEAPAPESVTTDLRPLPAALEIGKKKRRPKKQAQRGRACCIGCDGEVNNGGGWRSVRRGGHREDPSAPAAGGNQLSCPQPIPYSVELGSSRSGPVEAVGSKESAARTSEAPSMVFNKPATPAMDLSFAGEKVNKASEGEVPSDGWRQVHRISFSENRPKLTEKFSSGGLATSEEFGSSSQCKWHIRAREITKTAAVQRESMMATNSKEVAAQWVNSAATNSVAEVEHAQKVANEDAAWRCEPLPTPALEIHQAPKAANHATASRCEPLPMLTMEVHQSPRAANQATAWHREELPKTAGSAVAARVGSPSLKLALAMALIRFNRLHGNATSCSSAMVVDHWKRKAKQRKHDLQLLQEEIRLLRDGVGRDDQPPIASCRCHFFDNCGEMRPDRGDDGEHWIDDVLRRRFLRLVRWKDKHRKVDGPIQRSKIFEFNDEDETQRLGVSVDFLVELSDCIVTKGDEKSFSAFSHQAVDFILASLRSIITSQKECNVLEEIINGLIMRLMKRMCSDSIYVGPLSRSEAQTYVQHLFRKLGSEPFIGQRILLGVIEKISLLAESMLFVDLFDDAFPDMHGSMFILIQLVELLITDYMKRWLQLTGFDTRMMEEWARLMVKAQRDVEVVESMGGLYAVYMQRVVGELAKEAAPAAQQGMIDAQLFSMLLSC